MTTINRNQRLKKQRRTSTGSVLRTRQDYDDEMFDDDNSGYCESDSRGYTSDDCGGCDDE